jgi:hypothetical protein
MTAIDRLQQGAQNLPAAMPNSAQAKAQAFAEVSPIQRLPTVWQAPLIRQTENQQLTFQ